MRDRRVHLVIVVAVVVVAAAGVIMLCADCTVHIQCAHSKGSNYKYYTNTHVQLTHILKYTQKGVQRMLYSNMLKVCEILQYEF